MPTMIGAMIPTSCKGVPNLYDQCLGEQVGLQSRVLGQVDAAKRRQWRFGAPPWVSMPRTGQRYQKVEASVLPAVEGVDNLLLTYRVPYGYSGVLLTVTCLFSGTGFVEGSGDIVWRVRNNFRYFRDLGAVSISLGDLDTPYALEGGGYRIKSNDIIRLYAQLGAGALGVLDPAGRIIVGITGWIYPHSEVNRA